MKMFSLTRGGVAVSFAFFVFRSSVATVEEYTPLYMRQLGFSALYIGLIPILGLLTQSIGVPLFSFLADKFRARKLFLLLCILILIPNTLLFLAPRTPEQSCETSTGNSSIGNDSTTSNASVHAHSFLDASGISQKFPSLNRSRLANHTEFHNQTVIHHVSNGTEELKFFLIVLFLRGIFELFKRLVVTMLTVAAMTHTKDDKTKFGFYACWGEIGAGLTLFIVGILVSQIRHTVCDSLVPNFLVAFIFAAGLQCSTLTALPWLKYEYHEQRVVNYAEVKKVLFNVHYILLLFICAHAGLCSSFQTRWEFWYIQELGGSPIVMAVGGLLRRPIVAVWFLLSRSVINRLGELHVIAISLFIFSASFAALAFIGNPWLVIVFDIFQSAAYVLIFTSFVIHFSKASSKASAAFIQGTFPPLPPNILLISVMERVFKIIINWASDGIFASMCICWSRKPQTAHPAKI